MTQLTPGRRFKVSIEEMFMVPRECTVRQDQPDGEAKSVPAVSGMLWARVRIEIPNRKISGDYRVVTQTIPLTNLDLIELQDGDR